MLSCIDNFEPLRLLIEMKEANVVTKVIEYLSKKGYSKTEAMLRAESSNQEVESRLSSTRTEEVAGVKYLRAFGR